MSLEQPTLAELVVHAEKYGTECVAETAARLWSGRIPRPVELTLLPFAEVERILAEREAAFAAVRRDARRLRIELDTIKAKANAKLTGRHSVGRKRRRSRAESQAAIQVLLEDGLTRREIADKLGLSVRTVDFYLTPKECRTTADLGSGVRRHRTPANKGVEKGGLSPSGLGSTMRGDDEGQMPLWETA